MHAATRPVVRQERPHVLRQLLFVFQVRNPWGGSVLNRLQLLGPADVSDYVKRLRCGRAHDFADDLLGTPAARGR